MKRLLLAILLLGPALVTQATLYTTNWTGGFANGGVVLDSNLSGWSDSRTLNTMPAGTLVSVAVDLHLTGGWNGDLYAYLVNSVTGFSVLLDRVGSGTYGYGDAGMNVTLANAGANTLLGNSPQGSISTYQTTLDGPGIPTGLWTPDNTSGNLSSFTSKNGTWSLFIADLIGGDLATVQSWGLQMEIVAVPEVESWIAAALAGAFGAFWLNRQIWKGANPPTDRSTSTPQS